jgi:hypothetical protein
MRNSILKTVDQVTCLSISRKLKELGVRQDTFFIWTKENDVVPYYLTEAVCAAYTVGELGQLISRLANEWAQGYDDCGSFFKFQIGCRGAGSFIDGCGTQYWSMYDELEDENDDLTEANARGLLIIKLIEEKEITPQNLDN